MLSTMEFALESNIGSPFTAKLMKFDSGMATLVSRRDASVLGVFSVGTLTKVLNFVVGTVSVNMVNAITRPNSMMVKPSKSVGKVILAVDDDPSVSVRSLTTSHVSGSNFATASGDFPVKMPVGIGKSFKKFIMCNHTNIYQHDMLIVKNKGAISASHLQ
jgi:hypothetical protein